MNSNRQIGYHESIVHGHILIRIPALDMPHLAMFEPNYYYLKLHANMPKLIAMLLYSDQVYETEVKKLRYIHKGLGDIDPNFRFCVPGRLHELSVHMMNSGDYNEGVDIVSLSNVIGDIYERTVATISQYGRFNEELIFDCVLDTGNYLFRRVS